MRRKASTIENLQLAERLGMDKDTSRHTRIDGIISCNDYVAGYVSEELH